MPSTNLLPRPIALAALALCSYACGGTPSKTPAPVADGGVDADPKPYAWNLPTGFPAPRVPPENPMTLEKVELGRHLFYDPRLSGNGSQSCASCHEQQRAFADGRARAVGSTQQLHPRNAMALVNVAFNGTLTWANPALVRLEDQIPIPLFGEFPVEMGALGSESEILSRLRAEPRYAELFGNAFQGQDDPFTFGNIVFALASFSRALVSGDSPFDRFAYGNAADAISEGAKRGLNLFFSERLECFHCHGGFNFTSSVNHQNISLAESAFHNTGLFNIGGSGAYPFDNQGLFEFTGQSQDMGRFRAPTLRNIELSAPYMHDGSLATLDDVIDFYARGGRNIDSGPLAGDGRDNPFKSGFVSGFELNESERQDMLAFLRSLTDQTFVTNPAFSDPWR